MKVRARTGQRTIKNILRERRLHWLGHMIPMDHQRIPQQALYWEVLRFTRGPGRPRTRSTKDQVDQGPGRPRTRSTKDQVGQGPGRPRTRSTKDQVHQGPGRPRTNWRGIIKKGEQRFGLTWEKAEAASLDRQQRHYSMPQCLHTDMSWINVKVKVEVKKWFYATLSHCSKIFTCQTVLCNPDTFITISYLWNGFIEKLFEELELWNVTSRETAQHVKQQLNLIVMLSVTQRHRHVAPRPVQQYNMLPRNGNISSKYERILHDKLTADKMTIRSL